MNHDTSGTDIVHEIECALARSADPGTSKLAQSARVLDFLDSQRHKIEQGQWSSQSFYLDRMRLAWTNDWRSSDPSARKIVGQCLGNMGVRIAHAEQMKSLWGQFHEVGEALGISHPLRVAANFAARISQRREPDNAPEPQARNPGLR